MLKGRVRLLVGVMVAGLALPASSVPVSGQAAPPALAGLWRLDAEKSDQPAEGGEGVRAGIGRTTRYPGAGRTYGIPSGGRQESPPDLSVLQGLLRPVLQVLIQQTDSTVAISDAAGQLSTFRTDGRKIREPQLVGDDVEIVAKWKDGQLTIDKKLPSIGTIKETYSLDPVTGELILIVKVSGRWLPRGLEMRRVYDPATGGS